MWLATEIAATPRGPFDDFWFTPLGNLNSMGVRVSPATALSLPTFFACCLVFGQTLGTVPIHMYRRLDPRGKERATDHPLYKLIVKRPNRWQTSYQWRQMMQWHLALRYNAYSRILYDPRTGMPTELVPLHPDRMKVERWLGRDGVTNFRYRYTLPDATEEILTRSDVFHLRGLTSDGIEGFSPYEVQADSIAEAYAAQRYSGSRMKNDAKPGGVLEWANHFVNDEERRKFRASWQEAQAGANAGKVAVLEKGMTWKDLGISNADLQFIELRKLKREDVAAINRMPPHKVGIMESSTNNNIEHQGIEFLTDTMLPHFTNWVQELSVQLMTEDEQDEYFFEFMEVALLKGDAKTRGEYIGKRFNTGSLSPDDIREIENENPIGADKGGDRYFVPANLMPLDRVDEMAGKDRSPPGTGGQGGDPTENARAKRFERAASERVVRKESAALRRGSAKLAETAQKFYAAHADFVAEVMLIDKDAAAEYCQWRAASAERAEDAGAWLAALEVSGASDLLRFAGYEPTTADAILATGARETRVDVHNHVPVPKVFMGDTTVKVEAPKVTVTNDVHPAPVPVKVENTVNVPPQPDEVRMLITGMPERQSVSTTERDRGGNISKVTQTERDA